MKLTFTCLGGPWEVRPCPDCRGRRRCSPFCNGKVEVPLAPEVVVPWAYARYLLRLLGLSLGTTLDAVSFLKRIQRARESLERTVSVEEIPGELLPHIFGPPGVTLLRQADFYMRVSSREQTLQWFAQMEILAGFAQEKGYRIQVV